MDIIKNTMNQKSFRIGMGSVLTASFLFYVSAAKAKPVKSEKAKQPLLDRIGGEFAAEAIINRFIERLVGDENIRVYFKDKNVEVINN